MAAPKTPTDRAIADVEKAIKAHDTALEKAEAAQAKADEATAKANRADRELQWTALHPDLPEDFDLDAFRRSLEAPFDEGGDLEPTTTLVENTGEAEKVITPDVPSTAGDGSVSDTDETIGEDDDPWGEEEVGA